RSNIHDPVPDPWISIQIGTGRNKGIVSGIDAGRTGSQPKISIGLIRKQRGTWDIAIAKALVIRRATIILRALAFRMHGCEIRINNAVVQGADRVNVEAVKTVPSATNVSSRITNQRAVIQVRGIRSAAGIRGPVAAQQTVGKPPIIDAA